MTLVDNRAEAPDEVATSPSFYSEPWQNLVVIPELLVPAAVLKALRRPDPETVQPDNIDSLSDAAVLDLCESRMPRAQSAEFSELLEKQREAILTATEQARLHTLQAIDRGGLLRKSKALQVAIRRGLKLLPK